MEPDVKYQHVVGSWAHVAEDGVSDDDPYPDLVRPDGAVVFEPYLGSNQVVAAGSGHAVTVGEVRAQISRGVLRDLSDDEGVWLAAYIDSSPVWWSVRYEDLNFNGTPLPSRGVVFAPDLSGVNITSLVDRGDIDPGDVPSYQTARQSAAIAATRAQEALGSSRDAARSASAAASSADASSSSAAASRTLADSSAASARASADSASDSQASAAASAASASAAGQSAAGARAWSAKAEDVARTGLADAGVTAAKIADGAVTAAKIAPGATVPPTRVLDAGAGLAGGGDLSSDRSLSVVYGSGPGASCRGDDPRLSDERSPLDSSVTAAKIAPGSVTGEKIAPDAEIPVSALGEGSVRGSVMQGGVQRDAKLAIWIGTQSEYDAIAEKDPHTIYLVT